MAAAHHNRLSPVPLGLCHARRQVPSKLILLNPVAWSVSVQLSAEAVEGAGRDFAIYISFPSLSK